MRSRQGHPIRPDTNRFEIDSPTFPVKDVFGEALPAQTLIPVPKLAVDGMLFEVEAVAILE